VLLGPAERYSGLLAMATGEHEEALHLFDAAADKVAGAAPQAARLQVSKARALINLGDRGGPGNAGGKAEAARLLAGRDDLHFVVCGEGPNRARLEHLAAGLGNISFHDLQPAARVGELLSLASVHLLPQIAGAADLVLPSKLANMLFSGRPVVATALPGTGLYAEVDGCGAVTPPGDAAAFAAALSELLDDPSRAERLGSEARRRGLERWSQAAVLDRLFALLHAGQMDRAAR